MWQFSGVFLTLSNNISHIVMRLKFVISENNSSHLNLLESSGCFQHCQLSKQQLNNKIFHKIKHELNLVGGFWNADVK